MITWIVLRAAGIGAYLMVFGSVGWGLIATTSLFGKKVAKATAVSVHQFISTVAVVLLAAHLGGLLLDHFVRFRPLDLVLPLHSTFRPVAVAFGIAAMYATVIVLVSSWLKKRIGNAWWRRLHLFTVPAFTLAMVHGIFSGTDTVRPWMFWIYAATGTVVLFLLILRALTVDLRPIRAEAPAHARAAAARAATVRARSAQPAGKGIAT